MSADDGMDVSPSWQELKEERDAAADYASDQSAVLELVAKALGVSDEPHQGRAERILEAAERIREASMALVAHLIRYHTAYTKLTNSEQIEDADTRETMYLADSRLMAELDAIADDTPTTSLARLKAECWKEAYMAGMEHGHHLTVEGGYIPYDEEAAKDYVDDRQAEGGDS